MRNSDLVSTVVAMLHFAADHDAAGLHAPVGVVRESSCGLTGRQAKLVQHEKWVKIAECACAKCPANSYPRPFHHLLPLNHLQNEAF